MNWFERNLVNAQQINKHFLQKTKGHEIISANEEILQSNNNNQLIAPDTDIKYAPNAIRAANVIESQTTTAKPQINQQQQQQSTQASVIAVTNPPIISDEITTKYAPPWKSLINKIVQSNKKDAIELKNPIRTVDKAWSTVMAQLRATTTPTPIKTTTSPVPPESSRVLLI